MEDEFYQIYLDELARIKPCTNEEAQELALQILDGKVEVKERLIEGQLHQVVELVQVFKDCGIFLEDLVQEGNVALTLAVDSYEGGIWQTHLHQMVSDRIETAIFEQNQAKQSDEEVVAKVNVLKEVSQVLEDEFGRDAGVEELAQKMQMSVEEIHDLLQMTRNAMGLDG